MTIPDALVSHIAATIRTRQLFTPGEILIVGISGGADSTALLDLLTRLPDIPLKLVAAHLNHCLRGDDSDLDEDFCRKLAAQYGIPFELQRVDVKALAVSSSLSLEDAGRQARIHFFNQVRVTRGARAVVVGHHADDQAETVLMRLLRGSGMAGLSGMSYCNGRGYVRPLLDVSRTEIRDYLERRGLNWREDGSNQDRTYLRNRIRHEVLPLLEQMNPAVRKCLTATADTLSADNELLEERTTLLLVQLCRPAPHGFTVQVAPFVDLPRAMQRRVARRVLSDICGNLHHFNREHIDAICALAVSQRPNAILNLPRNICVAKEYGQLDFRKICAEQPYDFEIEITSPGEYLLPTGDRLTVETVTAAATFQSGDTLFAQFDLDKAPFPWLVRTMRPGDRISPLGMSGRKKVKDLFIDCKIPLSARRRTPLIFSINELVWVCGLRASQSSCLDAQSSRIARVVFSPGE